MSSMPPEMPATGNGGDRGQGRPNPIDVLKKAIAANPDNHAALHRLGCLFVERGDLVQGLDLVARAVRARPDYADGHVDLGVILRRAGQVDEAIKAYRAAIKIAPDHPGALNNFANLLKVEGQFEEAAKLYQRAIEGNSNYLEAYNNLGLTFHELGRYPEAIRNYERGLSLAKDNPEIHNNLGNALKELGRPSDALACYRRAVALRPNYAEAHSNMGVVLQQQDEPEKAAPAFRLALAADPGNCATLNGLGKALLEQGDYGGAEKAFRDSITAKPAYAEAHWNLANLLLLTGRLVEGWNEYEWRFHCPTLSAYDRRFAQPRWDGSALDGERVFVPSEQGLGDIIQFVRFLPMIERLGGVPILECPSELTALLAPMVGRDRLAMRGTSPSDCRFHAPLLSLPHILMAGSDDMPGAPYLTAPDRDGVNLTVDERPKIGLVWAGRSTHKNDHNRSIPLDRFEELLNAEICVFYGLQVGERRRDIERLGYEGRIRDLSIAFTDFTVTASVIAELDLVITVDTAVAHLAGALGKPVWTLLPFVPEWRWMLERDDTPCYRSMRLFRQPERGDWEAPLHSVRMALDEHCRSILR